MEPGSNSFSPQPEGGYPQSANISPTFSIATIIWVLRRGWRWPVLGCLIGLALAVSYVALLTTPYKSSARILLDRSLNRYLQTNRILDEPTFDEAEIGSQVYLLSSDGVVVLVVRSLDLIHDSEFVGPSKQGGAGVPAYIDGLKKFVKRSIGWNTVTPGDPEAALERSVVDAVLRRLTVAREDVANVISVTFESEDPNKAAKIANAVADSYISTTLQPKLNSTSLVSH